MSAADTAAIIAKLTPHMRDALTWPREPRLVPITLYSQTIPALVRRGLVDPVTYRFTPLGIEVRDVLGEADK